MASAAAAAAAAVVLVLVVVGAELTATVDLFRLRGFRMGDPLTRNRSTRLS